MTRRFWTDAEVDLLERLYPTTRTQQIAEQLRQPLNAVYAKAAQLGLHKTEEYLASPDACRLRRGDNVGAPFRFQKGHVPMNKGVKGWQAGGRARETQFKKGQWPRNKDPDFYVLGALRVNTDGYIDMRVSFEPGAKGWRTLHVILWEDAHGPVPKGHCLCFKDRDKLNVELENIELVHRADLMRRNTVHNLPAPLRSAIQLLGQVKRRIREKSDRGPARPPVRNARGPA